MLKCQIVQRWKEKKNVTSAFGVVLCEFESERVQTERHISCREFQKISEQYFASGLENKKL